MKNEEQIGWGCTRIHYRRIFWNFYIQIEDGQFYPRIVWDSRRTKRLKEGENHTFDKWIPTPDAESNKS